MTSTTQPTDFRTFYRSLTSEQKEQFIKAAGTSKRYIETHLVYARKIPGPKLMDDLYNACAQLGATFTKSELIAFFYEPNKDREKKCGVVDRGAASDDVNTIGGTVDKDIKEMRA
jgi:hypothetical protein